MKRLPPVGELQPGGGEPVITYVLGLPERSAP